MSEKQKACQSESGKRDNPCSIEYKDNAKQHLTTADFDEWHLWSQDKENEFFVIWCKLKSRKSD